MLRLRPESLRTIVSRDRGYEFTGVPRNLEYEPEILSIASQEWQLGQDFFPELNFNNGELLLADHHVNYYAEEPLKPKTLGRRHWATWLKHQVWFDHEDYDYGIDFEKCDSNWRNPRWKFSKEAPTSLKLKLVQRKMKRDYVRKFGIGLPFGNEEVVFPHEYPEWWDVYVDKKRKEAHKKTYGYELIDYHSNAWWDPKLDISIRGKASEKAWELVLECDWINPDCMRGYHNRSQLCLGCCLINALPVLEKLLDDQKQFLQEKIRRRSMKTYDLLAVNLDYNRNFFMTEGTGRAQEENVFKLQSIWYPPSTVSNLKRPWCFSVYHLFQPEATNPNLVIKSEILCRICESLCNDWVDCPAVIYDMYRKYSLTMRFGKRRLKQYFRVCGNCNEKYFRYSSSENNN